MEDDNEGGSVEEDDEDEEELEPDPDCQECFGYLEECQGACEEEEEAVHGERQVPEHGAEAPRVRERPSVNRVAARGEQGGIGEDEG